MSTMHSGGYLQHCRPRRLSKHMPACNVGRNERYLRLAMSAAALTALLTSRRARQWGLPLGVAAASGLFTGLTRYCPLNSLLGIQNCKGPEMIHFKEEGEGARSRIGARLNRIQRRAGAII